MLWITRKILLLLLMCVNFEIKQKSIYFISYTTKPSENAPSEWAALGRSSNNQTTTATYHYCSSSTWAHPLCVSSCFCFCILNMDWTLCMFTAIPHSQSHSHISVVNSIIAIYLVQLMSKSHILSRKQIKTAESDPKNTIYVWFLVKQFYLWNS